MAATTETEDGESNDSGFTVALDTDPEWLQYMREVIDDDMIDFPYLQMGDRESEHIRVETQLTATENVEVQSFEAQVCEPKFVEVTNEKIEEDSDDECVDETDWRKAPARSDDDDEEACERAKMCDLIFDEQKEMENVVLCIGLQFKNAIIFRKALKSYATDKGFDYIFTRNESTKVGAVCKEKDCPFHVYCSKKKGNPNLQIKKLVVYHQCRRAMWNDRVTSDFLADKYKTHIRDTPNIDIYSFQRKIRRELRTEVTESRIYRAIKRAQSIIHGDLAEGYKRLWEYCEIINRTNPESRCTLQVEDGRFKRLYMRFTPQRKGFLDGCRPFIGLDGCHLRGVYGGTLLAAVGRDANENMFPLCFAIVEQENKESWTWFMDDFFSDFGGPEEKGWVFLSDKQKGLVETLGNRSPPIEHRLCMRHMYDNWSLTFKGKEMADLLWMVAKCTTEEKYEKAMNHVKSINQDAYQWLLERPAKGWCRAFFSNRSKCAVQVNSLAESFNSWINKGRDKPIIQLCEFIRKKLMDRFYKKKQQLKDYQGPICPNIQLVLEYNKLEARNCFAYPSGNGRYEIEDGEDYYTVDILERSCSCTDWDITGIPCRHGIAAIVLERTQPEEFVHMYYSTSTFNLIYAGMINPVPGMSEWPETENERLLPPIVYRPPGRPKLKRIRGINEKLKGIINPYKVSKKGQEKTCSNCNKSGHNARSCIGGREDGETPTQRKIRLRKIRMASQPKSTKKKKQLVGKESTNQSTSNLGDKLDETTLAAIEKKRQTALARLAKKRKEPELVVSSQPPDMPQSLKDEIERKRLAALERLHKRAQQKEDQRRNTQQEEHHTSSASGVFTPTYQKTQRQKLNFMKKKLQTQNSSRLVKSSTPIMHVPTPTTPIMRAPFVGIAQQELNEGREKEHAFVQLRSENTFESRTSRFQQEARFSRTAMVGGRSTGQPATTTNTSKKDMPGSSTQLA